MSTKTVRINLHEALNAAHVHDKRNYPGARNLTGSCEYPELYLQYEADETGRPVGPAILYVGNGAGCDPDNAASDVMVLYRDGSMARVNCEECLTASINNKLQEQLQARRGEQKLLVRSKR